ncbi:MAG: redox-sensing transcriptional repressor Rex [Dehalococcoidia bacterium]
MMLEIPEVVINRLPVYARALADLQSQGEAVVSSHTLGEMLDVTPAQIRKDLSYFGRFGKQGRGYHVANLLVRLREILGLDRHWRVALVGVGRLGQAIAEYNGFAPQGFHVVAVFDANLELRGREIAGTLVRDAAELDGYLQTDPVDIGIVAVPAAAAQEVVDRMVAGGVRAILNYAPASPLVPADVTIRNVDPVLAMQSMTYYVKQNEMPAG